MTPEQFTQALSEAARTAIRTTVQTVNPILGAIMIALQSEPESYHRHGDLCPCNPTDEHANDCPIAIVSALSDRQKERLYRFAVHVFAPTCPSCERDNGLARSYPMLVHSGRRMLELD